MSGETNQSQFLGRVIDAVLIVVTGAVIAAVWGGVLTLSQPMLDWFHRTTPIQIGLALAIPPAALLLLVYLWGRDRFSHMLHYPYKPKRFFRITKQSISFEVVNGTIVYTKEKNLEALRDDVSFYEDMYRWTGSSTPLPVSKNEAHKVELDDRISIWQTYLIKFHHHLSKGDKEETSLVWTIPDTGDAVPFISTTVEEQTDFLRFCFKPRANSVSKVFFETKFSISAKRPFVTEELTANNNGEYVRELKPRLYYYYELKWVPR